MFRNLVSALLTSLFLCVVACAQPKNELHPDAFEKGISQHQAQLLDVRTAGEFRQLHLPRAMQADWSIPEQFSERIEHLDKQKPVYVYCTSGIRSAEAVAWLRKKGFTAVYDLEGGLISWNSANKPVERSNTTKQFTRAEYEKMISSSPVVLVDFGAEWCPPCKKMEPILAQLKKELPTQFMMVQVDAGIHTDVMKQKQVEKLPVFIVYKDGKETWRNTGITSLDDLKKAILP